MGSVALFDPLDRDAYVRQSPLSKAGLGHVGSAFAAFERSERPASEAFGERALRTRLVMRDRAELPAIQSGRGSQAAATQLTGWILREIDAALVSWSPLCKRIERLAAFRVVGPSVEDFRSGALLWLPRN